MTDKQHSRIKRHPNGFNATSHAAAEGIEGHTSQASWEEIVVFGTLAGVVMDALAKRGDSL